jgi:hypothetical protein
MTSELVTREWSSMPDRTLSPHETSWITANQGLEINVVAVQAQGIRTTSLVSWRTICPHRVYVDSSNGSHLTVRRPHLLVGKRMGGLGTVMLVDATCTNPALDLRPTLQRPPGSCLGR